MDSVLSQMLTEPIQYKHNRIETNCVVVRWEQVRLRKHEIETNNYCHNELQWRVFNSLYEAAGEPGENPAGTWRTCKPSQESHPQPQRPQSHRMAKCWTSWELLLRGWTSSKPEEVYLQVWSSAAALDTPPFPLPPDTMRVSECSLLLLQHRGSLGVPLLDQAGICLLGNSDTFNLEGNYSTNLAEMLLHSAKKKKKKGSLRESIWK